MKYIDKYQGSEVSFWEVFPYMKDTGLLKTLYKADRSKDKNKSSKVMWYLALTKDIDSEFYNLDPKDKYEITCDTVDLDVQGYLGSAEELKMYENYFEDFIDTVITADIRALESKLLERKNSYKIPHTPLTKWCTQMLKQGRISNHIRSKEQQLS